MLRVLIACFSIRQLKKVRVTNIAVNILDAMPQKSVTANPLTGPVPVCINIMAVSRVVIFESKMADNARE